LAHFIEDQTIPESFLSTVPLLIGEESGGRVRELVGEELQLPLPITVFKGKVKEIIADFYANPVSLVILAFLENFSGNFMPQIWQIFQACA
jgi:hypothetical protein